MTSKVRRSEAVTIEMAAANLYRGWKRYTSLF